LKNLVNLTSLNLSYNKIKDVSPLASMTDLITLNLNQNLIDNITDLSNLTALESLSLRYNSVYDLKPLYNLTGLKSVDLRNNPVSLIQIDELAQALPECAIYQNAGEQGCEKCGKVTVFCACCSYCGLPDCNYSHTYRCNFCGITVSFGIPVTPHALNCPDNPLVHLFCGICIKIDCGVNHCPDCEGSACKLEHIYCSVCDDYDCGIIHEYCNDKCRNCDICGLLGGLHGFGDVNGDGIICTADGVLVQLYITGTDVNTLLSFGEQAFIAARVTEQSRNSGNLSLQDAVAIFSYSAKLSSVIDRLPLLAVRGAAIKGDCLCEFCHNCVKADDDCICCKVCFNRECNIEHIYCGICDVWDNNCECPLCMCRNCDYCGFLGGVYGFGDVNGDGIICFADALEIHEWISRHSTMLDDDFNSFTAASIVNPGATPSDSDVAEILKFLNGILTNITRTELRGGILKSDCKCNYCHVCLLTDGEHNIECCEICSTKYGCDCFIKGDVNGDSVINMSDAIEVIMWMAKLPSKIDSNILAWNAACVTGGTFPVLDDAVQIIMYAAKIVSKYL
jgi:hypothetical protein